MLLDDLNSGIDENKLFGQKICASDIPVYLVFVILCLASVTLSVILPNSLPILPVFGLEILF